MIKFEDNTAYWCKTEELANKLLKEADRQGFKWIDGDSYLKYNCWHAYKERTCYLIKNGQYGYKSFYEQKHYKIVEVTAEMFKTMNREEIQAEIEKFCKWYIAEKIVTTGLLSDNGSKTVAKNYIKHNYPLEETKEMTVAELEKQLGYKIKIVK